MLGLLLACAAPLDPRPLERLYPTGNPARLDALHAGLGPAEVDTRLGRATLENPLDPARPFANPHQELVLRTPHGSRVEIWLYLTELRTHPECPQLTWADRPVLFIEGRLVAWTWDGLFERLEEIGRGADWYRGLRYPRFGACRGR